MTVSLGEGEFLFTSESVTEGHPDKIADQISDAVLDTALAADPYSRVACETVLTTGLVLVAGEITTSAHLDIPEIVRSTIRGIGYTADCGFDGDACAVLVALDRQSPDISRGVDMAHEARHRISDSALDGVGAGDQGMMFGYATNETPELMPMPISLAHRLARQLAYVRKTGQLPFLRPDGKTQVTVRYSGGVPVAVEKVLISAQHEDGAEHRLAGELWDNVVLEAIPASLYDAKALRQNFYVNPTGRFVVGGPVGDAGLTGRKIIVDTYGGFARHGGGAFSGNYVLGDVARHITRRAIHLRWVFAGKCAAAMTAVAPVSVNNDLASSQARVAHGSADHKATRRVDVILRFRIQHRGGNNRFNHMLRDSVAKIRV